MADFGNLSDTDDSAVDELISQIQDLSVLEQVSKINTCSFTDSLLPSHLDTRFQRLKSLPNPIIKSPISSDPTPKTKDQLPHPVNPMSLEDVSAVVVGPLNSFSSTGEAAEEEGNLDGKKVKNKSKQDQFHLSPSNSSRRSSNKGLKLESGFFGSPLDSPISSMDSPSPPGKSRCFWCSPKKKKKKKKEEKKKFDWGKRDDEVFMSAFSSFSVKEQEKILKKAMKEEERINREAEKIVKWAKLASNKLNFGGHEHEFSDDDDDDHKQ